MKCPDCNRDFPPHLLSDMAIKPLGGKLRYEKKCPLCGLKTMNELNGLPEGTPFRGPKAAAMHKEALAHLKITGQGE